MAVGSWTEWSRHVLHELERLDECYTELEKRHSDFRDCVKKEIGKLKQEQDDELKKVRLEQAKIKTKIAVIVAILTTIGNTALYGIAKLVWPLIFG
ncbi:MAG: hypothetical protein KAS36_00440 [Anaerolineales bacterium]|nr:hypothetical protein [Anaerolineales bacterium]